MEETKQALPEETCLCTCMEDLADLIRQREGEFIIQIEPGREDSNAGTESL